MFVMGVTRGVRWLCRLANTAPLLHRDDVADHPLSSSRWLVRTHPFPHVVADDVFPLSIYERLVAAFRRRFEQAEAEQRVTHTRNYQADIVALREQDRHEFPVLLDRAWHDLLARTAGTAHSGEIDGALHRHAVGSASGWVHTDFMASWFDSAAAPGEALVAGRVRGGGAGPASPCVAPVERVRALAMILFLDNHWSEGRGGETGLYRHAHQAVDQPDVRIAPRNNSLLAFECTPHSYHSFLTNTHHPRHSIILWLHRGREATVAKWGTARVR